MQTICVSKVKKLIHRFIKDESAAETLEAAIIYPVVILFLFFLIYIGLYIMQNMTVAAYAEKVAMLASREVSHPGYLDMFIDGENVFNTSATEGDYGNETSANNVIMLYTNVKDLDPKPYRYWSKNPLGDKSGAYENILREVVKNNSLLATNGTLGVKVYCDNQIVTQYIDVEVTQQMMDFPVLTFFGIESPTLSYKAKASVSDTDEFIRNINFAADAIEEIADRCGIDTSKVHEKVKQVKDVMDKLK